MLREFLQKADTTSKEFHAEIWPGQPAWDAESFASGKEPITVELQSGWARVQQVLKACISTST